MSKTQWVIGTLVVLVVAFIGSSAGRWFAGWRQDRARRDKLEKLYSKNPASLAIGEAFPLVELSDTDGGSVDLEKFLDGHRALVFFLAPSCDMCSDLVDAYRGESGKFPADLKAFGICPDIPEEAQLYESEHDMPFPLYCDTAQSFQIEYGVVAFPTMMALDTQGVIRYMNFGMMDDYDFGDILEKLKHY